VEVAARLVAARFAALGVLDRTGSHLDRLITTGIDDTTRTRIGDLPSDQGFSVFSFEKRVRSVLPT
jgi:hypothetical protein